RARKKSRENAKKQCNPALAPTRRQQQKRAAQLRSAHPAPSLGVGASWSTPRCARREAGVFSPRGGSHLHEGGTRSSGAFSRRGAGGASRRAVPAASASPPTTAAASSAARLRLPRSLITRVKSISTSGA